MSKLRDAIQLYAESQLRAAGSYARNRIEAEKRGNDYMVERNIVSEEHCTVNYDTLIRILKENEE